MASDGIDDQQADCMGLSNHFVSQYTPMIYDNFNGKPNGPRIT